jgi:hypothetical protein
VAWGIPRDVGTYLFGLLNVSQAGLMVVVMMAVVAGAHLFSQCNMAWSSFLQAKVSGCQSFDSPWCLISAKSGSSISAKFWDHGAHTVWFCTLVTILDPCGDHSCLLGCPAVPHLLLGLVVTKQGKLLPHSSQVIHATILISMLMMHYSLLCSFSFL